MATQGKQAISRTRCKVRIVGFNDMLTEGNVFLAYNQRISDLLNDDRDFLPIETDEGEVKVISKRAIMEVEVLELDRAEAPRGKRHEDVVAVLSANAYDVIGVAHDADDATIRLRYMALKDEVSRARLAALTANTDLLLAAEQIGKRYDAAYDSITNARKIEAIAIAMRDAQPKRRRFGEA
ncbi:MAG TPA: hypothetical protein DDZ68_12720 [Parvularcula sp.]|nr:hypothetical protein [Parvularcula sp.]HBS30360.1 hypothetical protein [Parvularcula sp.]HBS35928.1 hypothetical protein [Parvularcula sp.]